MTYKPPDISPKIAPSDITSPAEYFSRRAFGALIDDPSWRDFRPLHVLGV